MIHPAHGRKLSAKQYFKDYPLVTKSLFYTVEGELGRVYARIFAPFEPFIVCVILHWICFNLYRIKNNTDPVGEVEEETQNLMDAGLAFRESGDFSAALGT